MSSNYPELIFSADEDFDEKRLNKAMEVIDQRLRALEPFSPQWEAAVAELRLFGLARLNETIQPAYDRVQQLATFGFLVGKSTSSVTLVVDQDKTFIIEDGAQRDLFTPTPYLALTREANVTDYAVARLKSYDKSNGRLVVTVQSISGNPGPFTDWWIGPLAGNVLASQTLLSQVQTARDIASAARTQAQAAAVQTAEDRVQTGLDRAAATNARAAAEAARDAAQVYDPANFVQKGAAGTISETITFEKSPSVPNVAANDNSTKAANTAFVRAAIAALVGSSPAALDTLVELAAALGNDANFATTVTNALAGKVSKAGDTMSGTLNITGDLVASNRVYAGGVSGGYLDTNGDIYMPWAGNKALSTVLNGKADIGGVSGTFSVGSTLTIGTAYINTTGDIQMPWCNNALSNKLIHKTDQWYTTAEGWARLHFAWGGASNYRGGAAADWCHAFFIQEDQTRWLMNGNGDFYATGNLIAFWSDERLKENIVSVEPSEGLDRVLRYRVVDFGWNAKGRELNGRPEGTRERGLIAQETEKINREAVCDNLLGTDENGDPYLSLKEQKIIFDLIGAVQEQQKMIDDLRRQLEDYRHGDAR